MKKWIFNSTREQTFHSRCFFPSFWLNHRILHDKWITVQQRLHPQRTDLTHWRLPRLQCYLALVHPTVRLKSSIIIHLKTFTCSRVILSITFLFFVLVRKREAHFLFLFSVVRWPDSSIAWSQSNFPLLPIGSIVVRNTQFEARKSILEFKWNCLSNQKSWLLLSNNYWDLGSHRNCTYLSLLAGIIAAFCSFEFPSHRLLISDLSFQWILQNMKRWRMGVIKALK